MSPLNRCFVFMAAGLVALAILMPGELSGQDCGKYCGPCAEGGKEGYSYEEDSPYNMYCIITDGGCLDCDGSPPGGGGLASAVDGWPQAVVDALADGNGTALTAAVKLHEELVLFDWEHQVLALRGTACDPDDVSSVMLVDEDQAVALKAIGLPSLSDHLANRPVEEPE